MKRLLAIEPARIEWRDGAPYSADFGDIYFNPGEALAETRHVFLEGNGLPEAWRGRDRFVIAETGFGTGLNLLATAALWLERGPPGGRLHFLSVEKHPLRRADLERALAAWPAFAPLGRELLAGYPPPVAGYHRIELAGGHILLTLMLGEAREMFEGLRARVDCWFLDGFAPARNPRMWEAPLLEQIARLSRPGTRFATFTAAGAVRRGLQAVGFEVERAPGFGRKREMLLGTFRACPAAPSATPWFEPPVPWEGERRAVVVGAGLAGCSAAHALVRRGWEVTLIDRAERIAAGASGNHSGVVLPRLSADGGPEGRFYLTAFLDAVRRLDALGPASGWRRSGVLQFLDEKMARRLDALALPEEIATRLTPAEASRLAATTIESGALLYPLGGWLSPPRLCRHLIENTGERLTLRLATKVTTLERRDGSWHLRDDATTVAEAPLLVLANGADAARLFPELLPLRPVRGQLAYLRDEGHGPALPICHQGYLVPPLDGLTTAGATYANDDEPQPRDADRDRILATLAAALPDWHRAPVAGERVAFRASSRDYLPVAGPLPDAGYWREAYRGLQHGLRRRARPWPPARHLPGLFVTSGHGSRGLVSCLPSAELIAAQIEGEPLPLSLDLAAALHPGRFLLRALKKGKNQI